MYLLKINEENTLPHPFHAGVRELTNANATEKDKTFRTILWHGVHYPFCAKISEVCGLKKKKKETIQNTIINSSTESQECPRAK